MLIKISGCWQDQERYWQSWCPRQQCWNRSRKILPWAHRRANPEDGKTPFFIVLLLYCNMNFIIFIIFIIYSIPLNFVLWELKFLIWRWTWTLWRTCGWRRHFCPRWFAPTAVTLLPSLRVWIQKHLPIYNIHLYSRLHARILFSTQAYKHTSIQAHKHTSTQAYKYTTYKHTSIQAHKQRGVELNADVISALVHNRTTT